SVVRQFARAVITNRGYNGSGRQPAQLEDAAEHARWRGGPAIVVAAFEVEVVIVDPRSGHPGELDPTGLHDVAQGVIEGVPGAGLEKERLGVKLGKDSGVAHGVR